MGKNQGWVSIHRELTEKSIWINSTPEQKVILITLLLMANHEENEWEWKGQKYKVKAGQMITSLDSIISNCGKGITIQNVRTALKRFEKFGFLTNESTNSSRLITIVNWGKYQGIVNEPNKDFNKQLTSNQQAANKQLTTNNNDNNDLIMINNDDKTEYVTKINSLINNKISSSSLDNFINHYGINCLNLIIEEIRRSDYLKNNINFNNLNDDFINKAINGRYRNFENNNYIDDEGDDNKYGKVPPLEF